MKETSSAKFRALMRELSMLIGYQVTADLPLMPVQIETPMQSMQGQMLEGRDLVFVPILRAGLGILDGMLQLVPSAAVGHVGLYRDPSTLVAVEYYFKVPEDSAERHLTVLDPMLATGHSAVAALHRLKEIGPKSLKLVCIVASPEGVAAVHDEHPDVHIYTASVDKELNDHGYILPGLGDAGDRLFETR